MYNVDINGLKLSSPPPSTACLASLPTGSFQPAPARQKSLADIISSLGNYSCSQFNAFVSFRKRFVIKLMESNAAMSGL